VNVDLLLVGGGLANCLIAFRLAERRPDLRTMILERGPTLAGHHTWSFHEHDLTAGQWSWMRPFAQHSWPRHEVRFPGRTRTLSSPYHTVSSRHLAGIVTPLLGDRIRLDTDVREVLPTSVRLADGSAIEASAVIDGRGDPRSPHLDIAYQKFIGRFVTTRTDHDLDGPILMDATVQQQDGYRFVYTLPLSEKSLLIEDTRYSDSPTLDHDTVLPAIDRYAQAHGWRVADVTGEEQGVLPIVLSGDIGRFWDDGPVGVPRSGMRAALFHPTTGYSLPEAVRLADDLAARKEFNDEELFVWTRRRSEESWRRNSFFRLLNRMLFRAAEPDQRYRVLERFYGLPEPLIRRFYAGRLRWSDKLRLVTGSPPVPIGRALGCVLDQRRRKSLNINTDNSGGSSS
jgi:lycopene beta-cyclase